MEVATQQLSAAVQAPCPVSVFDEVLRLDDVEELRG